MLPSPVFSWLSFRKEKVCVQLLYQINFYIPGAISAGLSMGIKKDINMPPLYSASAVFRCVKNAADHQTASVRDHAGVHRDGMVCGGNGSGARKSAPLPGALSAGTVGSGTENA